MPGFIEFRIFCLKLMLPIKAEVIWKSESYQLNQNCKICIDVLEYD